MLEIPGREDLSPEELRRFAHESVDWMVSYLTSFGEKPIQPGEPPARVFSLLREPLPEEGSAPGEVLQEFVRKIVPFATDLQHPGNFGYIPNSSGIVGIVADLLAATLNQNVSLVRGGGGRGGPLAPVSSRFPRGGRRRSHKRRLAREPDGARARPGEGGGRGGPGLSRLPGDSPLHRPPSFLFL